MNGNPVLVNGRIYRMLVWLDWRAAAAPGSRGLSGLARDGRYRKIVNFRRLHAALNECQTATVYPVA